MCVLYICTHTQARQDMTVALTIVFTTLLHHKATLSNKKNKQSKTSAAAAITIQKLQYDTDTSACMSLYGVYISVAYCAVQHDVQKSEVDTVIQLFNQGQCLSIATSRLL